MLKLANPTIKLSFSVPRLYWVALVMAVLPLLTIGLSPLLTDFFPDEAILALPILIGMAVGYVYMPIFIISSILSIVLLFNGKISSLLVRVIPLVLNLATLAIIFGAS